MKQPPLGGGSFIQCCGRVPQSKIVWVGGANGTIATAGCDLSGVATSCSGTRVLGCLGCDVGVACSPAEPATVRAVWGALEPRAPSG